MHHVLYSWSELVELDKHCQHLEDAIYHIDQLTNKLSQTDNLELSHSSSLITLRELLQQQLDDILKQFPT